MSHELTMTAVAPTKVVERTLTYTKLDVLESLNVKLFKFKLHDIY